MRPDLKSGVEVDTSKVLEAGEPMKWVNCDGSVMVSSFVLLIDSKRWILVMKECDGDEMTDGWLSR